jgi:hypothetical protein
MLRIHRFAIALAAVGSCIAWPSAAPAISPDAIDAGDTDTPQLVQPDLRSPDAVYPIQTTVDKRSPDVRFGQPNGEEAPTAAPVRVRIIEVPSSGFEWGDAGVGAATMLALVLVGVGAALANAHRRGRRMTARTR